MRSREWTRFIFFCLYILLLGGCNNKISDPGDSEKPTVAILFPPIGAELKVDTIYTIIADASDNSAVSKVEFYIDGANVFVASPSLTQYEYHWNTQGKTGDHTIMAKAYDKSGNIGQSSVVTIKVKEKVINRLFGYVKNSLQTPIVGALATLHPLSGLPSIHSAVSKMSTTYPVSSSLSPVRIRKIDGALRFSFLNRSEVVRNLKDVRIQNTKTKDTAIDSPPLNFMEVLSDTSVRTNTQGYYEVDGLEKGNYLLNFSAVDYDPLGDTVQLAVGATMHDVQLKAILLPQVTGTAIVDKPYALGISWDALSNLTLDNYSCYERHFFWYAGDWTEDKYYLYPQYSADRKANTAPIKTNSFDAVSEESNANYLAYILPVNVDQKMTSKSTSTIECYIELPSNREILADFSLTSVEGPISIRQSSHKISLGMRFFYTDVIQSTQIDSWSVQFSVDSVNWTTVATHTLPTGAVPKSNYGYTRTFSLDNWKGKTFYYRTNPQSNPHPDPHIGNLTIENILGEYSQDGTPIIINNPPAVPTNPNPANGATGISTSPTLSWSCSDPDGDALAYDVYFGTSSNPTTTISTNQNTTNIARNGLTNNTTYYWKIVAKDSKGAITTGPVWSFLTATGAPPIVTTTVITGITSTTALGGGNVTSQGSASVTARGVCWSTSQNPTIANSTTSDGTGTGSYTSSITGLSPSTPYYVRAYAINSAGTSYGNQVTFTTGSGTISPGMVAVTGGTFQMGSSNSLDYGANPPHQVTVGSFSIDKYEITYEKWTEIYNWGLTHGYTDLPAGQNGYNPVGANNPVTSVSWYDIVKWCNARSEKDGLAPVYYNTFATVYRTGQREFDIITVKWAANGYRLPTEAEWEFAAKGGTKAQSPTPYIYSGNNTIGDVAWYDLNSGKTTHTVGGKTANELGIYDMSGNVWEWCWDWAGAYSDSAQTDPKGAASGISRVLRGGSFYDLDKCCRSAYRNIEGPDGRSYVNGFRCVQD